MIGALPVNAARHSMDSPEWYTPSPFVEAARDVMGAIDLDPASHEEANGRIVKAARFYSEAENGLAQKWYGRILLNPPGGKDGEGDSLVVAFWRKFCDAALDLRIEQGVWIGYSLEQLQTLQNAQARAHPLRFPMCIPRQRIAFVENEAKKAARIDKMVAAGKIPNQKSQPSHANYITYVGANVASFKRIFGQFGEVRL